ncbi:MAG: amidohydrolase family protein [Gammaproteobacteria bacterium]|jgi:predicted TIM-barrel fold metal-dependent hydrolase|nr:amidohydrolase family protein [Gammaproteobacteria bacterium]MDP6616931.1 amidohydrolase family protein [Gammaproteobacteria bacterium]MDP6696045.1 amidohydrolase family protein [Gammaproteobacteria bacterium]
MKSRLSLLAAVALLSACSTEPPEQFGIVVDGSRIQVVDLHTHTGTWENTPPGFRLRLAERVPTGFRWTMTFLTDLNLGAGNILSQMNSGGIYGAGVFATIAPHTTGISTSEFAAQTVVGNEDRLYAFATIRVDRWNEDGEARLRQFEEELRDLPGVKGVKIAHAHQQFRFDDERFNGIYEISGRYNKPIYLHTGTSPNPGTRYEPEYSDPAYLEEVINMYPDTIFILGHTGYDSKERALTYTDSAIRLAQEYPNVYMEPGALGAHRAEHVIDDFVTRLKDGNVLHKVIYGSDGVQFPGYLKSHLEAYVAAMQRNGYTVDEMAMVLSGNFSRLFGIEIPGVEAAATTTGAGE